MDRVADSAARGPSDTDVLVVGGGPTGLTLAAQLRTFGVPFRIIDRSTDRTRESRALAVQARTLEILQTLGLSEALIARGRTSTRVALHADGRALAEVELGTADARDTRFPYILFVSQAETEALLNDHLQAEGVAVERGVELLGLRPGERGVHCGLRHADGRDESIVARYVVGCDGAHSTVRKQGGFSFDGGSYPQQFLLGDLEADGPLVDGAINSFLGGGGVAMFFPLGRPRSWRVIALDSAIEAEAAGPAPPGSERDPPLSELQDLVDAPTAGRVRLRDPAWITRFRLHHRQTGRYRRGRLFLAGDAAHVHSPVGAQGMNTGIQDAWNLGWKLALVCRGDANARLLDSYEEERWPVGRFLLRYTDRVFATFMRVVAKGRLTGWVRRHVVPRLLPPVFRSRRLRASAFRFVSELGVRYRSSRSVTEGEPRLDGGPRAGDRLPDAGVMVDGRRAHLQETLVGPRLGLLLCGDARAWDVGWVRRLCARRPGMLRVVHLGPWSSPGALADPSGEVLDRLGVRGHAQYLVRPDGHVAFRCGGTALESLEAYLDEWFPPRPLSRSPAP